MCCGEVGEPGLAGDRAGIARQQFVLVGDCLAGELRRPLLEDLGDQRVGQRRAVDHREVVRRRDRLPARTVQPRRRRRLRAAARRRRPPCDSSPRPRRAVRRACRPACSPRRCPTPSAAPPAVGGWCTAWPGSSPTQEHSTSVWDWLARAKLSGRRLSSTTIASNGLIVLAGACCRVRIVRRQNASGVEVGQQPRLRRPVGERDRAGRLDAGLSGCGRCRRPRSSRTRARLSTQPTSFARSAERILCDHWF